MTRPVFGALPAAGTESTPTLDELFDCPSARNLRRVPGRTTFAWPERGAPCWVVKRFAGERFSGGEWRERWYARLRGRLPCPPGRREFDNLRGLAADGLPVPQALAWAGRPPERPGWLGGARSLVVMRWVPHSETLRERIASAGAAERRRLCERLLEVVLRLHAAGWYHRDLYLQHFVLREAEGPELALLDVGRARKERAPRRRWLEKDLAALSHSAPACVPARERLRFLAAYLDARGVTGRRARRRWARAIEARRARVAAHVPRHGEGARG